MDVISAFCTCTDGLWSSCLFLEDELTVISISSTLSNGPLGKVSKKGLTFVKIIFIFIIDECHLSVLVKFVKEVDDDWKILGTHLDVKVAVIKILKHSITINLHHLVKTC